MILKVHCGLQGGDPGALENFPDGPPSSIGILYFGKLR